MQIAGREGEHEDVYGKSFALYDKEEVAKFADYFTQRFAANGLDAKAIFAGKRCLDAGCGGGRGSLFMLMNGAAHVTAIDVSPLNIETTARNCKAFGYDAVSCRQTTLESIPFDDGAFDFVWCNGVIMHTDNPDRCLTEITRVLKIGGDAWIYVYGAGGLYWHFVRHFREILDGLPTSQLLATLQLMDQPVRYIGEYMDDWKVPYLRAYTEREFSSALGDLGFEKPRPLARGVSYDTSERRTVYPADIPWYGEGDLRYLARKSGPGSAIRQTLTASWLDQDQRYSAEVRERFAHPLARLRELAAHDPVLGVIACVRIQRKVRDTLSNSGALDIAAIETAFRGVLEQLAGAVGQRA